MIAHSRFYIPSLVVSLVGLSLLASQMYNPALPLVAEDFQVSSNQAQYTLSALMLGIVLSGIVYGPLSDVWGRRYTVLLSLALHCSMAAICIYVSSIVWFTVGCFLLGVGGGGGGVLGLAILKDHFVVEKDTAKVMAQMSMAIVLIPTISQIVGANLAALGGWRLIFLVLCVLSGILWWVHWKFLPETRVAKPGQSPASLNKIFYIYRDLLTDTRFVCLTSIHTLLFCGVYCYMVVAPFVFINILGVSVAFYGFYIAGGSMSYIAASYLSQRLVNQQGTTRLISFGLGLCLSGGLLFLLLCVFLPTSPILISIVFAIYISGIPFIMPTSIAKAMEGKVENTGAAASIVTSLRMLMAFIGTIIGGLLPDGNFYGVAVLLIILVLCAKWLAIKGVRSRA